MRVTSDLSKVRPYENVPKGIYPSHIKVCEATMPDGKGGIKALVSKAGNPMFINTWMIDGTGHAEGGVEVTGMENKEIRFDMVVYGGTIGKGPNTGQPITPFSYANLIEATGTAWECGKCHAGPRSVDFERGNGSDGFQKGALICPDCHQLAEALIETDDLVGARCRIAVDIEPIPGKDTLKNVIKAYLKL